MTLRSIAAAALLGALATAAAAQTAPMAPAAPAAAAPPAAPNAMVAPDGITWVGGVWMKGDHYATATQIRAHKKWMRDNNVPMPQ